MDFKTILTGLKTQVGKEVQEIRSALHFFLIKMAQALYGYLHSRQVQQAMSEADTYEEWEKHARELDRIQRNTKWKADMRSHHYDYKNSQYLYLFLKQLRKKGITQGLMYTLRSHLSKNLYGTANPKLYE